MRNKRHIYFITAVFMSIALSMPAFADLSLGMNDTKTLLGDAAPLYTNKTLSNGQEVDLIRGIPKNAIVWTESYIRKEPTMESEHLTAIDEYAKVKVWGYADAEWCQVYVEDPDGNSWYGFIRGYLLNEVSDFSQEEIERAVKIKGQSPTGVQ